MSLVSGYPAATYGPTDSFCPSGFYPQNHPAGPSLQVSDYSNQQQHFYSSSWAWNPQSIAAQNSTEFGSCYNSSCNSSPCHYGGEYTMTGPGSGNAVTLSNDNFSPLADSAGYGVPRIRVVKRRTTANKKERRRTQSINNAFTELRDCIPNVPADTKLSKIKTLRLATSYISYLMSVLEAGDAEMPFRAELTRPNKCEQQHRVAAEQVANDINCHSHFNREKVKEELMIHPASSGSSSAAEKRKGRTGWPHHVWALELKP